jgi:aminoglycoside phosphotransferase (APT) family kinase protein
VQVGSAIEDTLSAVTGQPVRLASPPEPLGGGFSSQLFTFRIADPPDSLRGDLVLRVPPSGGSVMREGVIQREVAAAGFPAPPVRLLSVEPDTALGPFLVMPKIPGRPMFSAGPVDAFNGFRRAPGVFARLMTDLHGLDPEPVARELETNGVRADELGAAPLLDDLRDAADRASTPGLAAVVAWIDAGQPPPSKPVVCHGDLHALNIVVDGDHCTLVDWELATIGDPALDVARTCLLLSAVPMELPKPARGVVQRLGRGAATRFRAAYTERRPLDSRALTWYQVLHTARIVGRLARREAEPRARADPVLDAWAPTLPYLRAELRRLTGIDLSGR